MKLLTGAIEGVILMRRIALRRLASLDDNDYDDASRVKRWLAELRGAPARRRRSDEPIGRPTSVGGQPTAARDGDTPARASASRGRFATDADFATGGPARVRQRLVPRRNGASLWICRWSIRSKRG